MPSLEEVPEEEVLQEAGGGGGGPEGGSTTEPESNTSSRTSSPSVQSQSSESNVLDLHRHLMAHDSASALLEEESCGKKAPKARKNRQEDPSSSRRFNTDVEPLRLGDAFAASSVLPCSINSLSRFKERRPGSCS